MAIRNNVISGSTVRRISDLPGPSGLPLIGSALQIRRESLHQTLEQWSREYGAPFRFRIARQEYVVISDPETIAAVLRDRPDGFKRRRRLEETARELGFNGLFSANGGTWKRQRPMVVNGLNPVHVKAFFPTLVKVTERFARRWHRAAAANAAIDLLPDLMRYTVDVTAGLAFGVDVNTTESDQEVIQSHLDKLLPALFQRVMAPVPYWRYLKLPSDRQLDRHLAAIRRAVDGFIGDARRRLVQQPGLREQPSNLIEAMIAARDREDSKLTDADISGNVLTMLLAGEDTTAATLAWIIWFLHRHREVMDQASREVKEVLGDDACPTSHDQLRLLDFIEACANETMRLKPVAPILLVEAVRETVVGGLTVPTGTLLMCLTRPGAIDERHFPDPQTFRPARWVVGTGEPEVAGSARRAAIPFGAGPRMCPGRYLAIAEIKMVIAMLLASFEVESVTIPDGGEPRERLAFSLSPVGLKLHLRRRNALEHGTSILQ